jgi:hypothetical protein
LRTRRQEPENYGIEYVKNLSNLQATSIADFEKDFVSLKNEWLAAIDSSLILIESDNPIVYAYNGKICPLSFATKRAKYFILASFEEVPDTMYNVNAFKSDYSVTKALILSNEKEMDDVDKAAKSDTYTYGALLIIYCSLAEVQAIIKSAGGVYMNNLIYTSSNFCLIHEYTHYLTLMNTVHDSWQLEAVAYYFGYQIIENKIDCVNNLPSIMNGELINKIETHLGRAYEADDLFTFLDIYIILNNKYTLGTSTGVTVASIANYICNTYGQSIMVQILSNEDTVTTYTGKTWTQIINDWKTYLQTTYGDII